MLTFKRGRVGGLFWRSALPCRAHARHYSDPPDHERVTLALDCGTSLLKAVSNFVTIVYITLFGDATAAVPVTLPPALLRS